MKILKLLLATLALTVTLVGCATGPEFAKYSATIQPVAAGQGRIWFYRPSKMFGGVVQPNVFLNEQKVGKAQPGCYFFADRAPGDYEVKCTTEWSDKANLKLAAGEERYVRLTLGIGLFVGHIVPKEVDKAKGLDEIANCKLITADGANAEVGAK